MSTTPVGKALEKVISEVRQAEKLVEDGAPSEDSVLDKIDAVGLTCGTGALIGVHGLGEAHKVQNSHIATQPDSHIAT